jgi:hypothetical protein
VICRLMPVNGARQRGHSYRVRSYAFDSPIAVPVLDRTPPQ